MTISQYLYYNVLLSKLILTGDPYHLIKYVISYTAKNVLLNSPIGRSSPVAIYQIHGGERCTASSVSHVGSETFILIEKHAMNEIHTNTDFVQI